ncbi:MAG: biopolymer transporter ExbD [Flavobacteriaceae bacterium]|nr:biopolymer transporter ExbD [Flavobacteriaceae bacterium]
MKNTRFIPEINAGSMADIAFLLLIFFLVSTTLPNDKGIVRGLPPKCIGDCTADIAERNIFKIEINKNNELLINTIPFEVSELPKALIAFIDNNGDGSCTYCKGSAMEQYSDNPAKAIISIHASGASSYKIYIAVQAAITKSYLELREAYGTTYFKKSIAQLSEEELKNVREAYPLLISEATLK